MPSTISFAAINAALDGAIAEGVLRAAEHVRGVSVGLAPVETGNLRASAEVRPHGKDEAEVYYPGPYARNQHYSLDFRHTAGQALFLEQPGITETPRVVQIVTESISAVL